MANAIKVIIILFIFLPLLSTNAVAASWYVRPAGGSYGAENGTSYINAWDGISSIVWSGMSASDTLYICGEHVGPLFVSKDGTAEQQFTVSGNCPDDAGSITAVDSQALRYISDGSYIDFRDLTLSSNAANVVFLGYGESGNFSPAPKIRFYNVNFSGSTGVCLRYASTEGVISGGTFTNCLGGAVMTYNSENVLVENLFCDNNGTLAENTDDIGINDGSCSATVRNNTIINGSGGSGIDMQDSTPCSGTSHVYGNYISGRTGHGLTVGGVVETEAFNNVSVDNSDTNFGSHGSGHAIFYNNTSLGSTNYALKIGFTTDGVQNVTAINNNFASGTVTVFVNSPSDTFYNSNNIFGISPQFQIYDSGSTTTYNWDDWQASGWNGADNLSQDPINDANGRLAQLSPAINAGTNLDIVTTDYDGNPRLGITDIGAFESQWQVRNSGVGLKGLSVR